ncbi:MAG: tyrosine-protein phosphatase [Candidatus Omnitrophica bacterium]|nr:tyrosine-protein phosphatase [Candidatus Omnitrophota bacterium]
MIKTCFHLFPFFFVASLVFASCGFADDNLSINNINIKRFAKVDTNLYRGSQPDEADFTALKEAGIKRIINFRTEENLVERERRQVESLGMEYIHIPWLIYLPYDQKVFNRFFEAIQDKDKKPIFFHCKRGTERTGVMAAAYKTKVLDFSADTAFKDAETFGLHSLWYYFVKTKIEIFAQTENK